MTIQTAVIPSVAPGKTRTVTKHSGQYTLRILVDDIEVLSKIRGRPWTIADACRGAWRMIRES